MIFMDGFCLQGELDLTLFVCKGVSGSFTHANWPHLHLTTKKDGKVFDPGILLKYVQCITK